MANLQMIKNLGGDGGLNRYNKFFLFRFRVELEHEAVFTEFDGYVRKQIQVRVVDVVS